MQMAIIYTIYKQYVNNGHTLGHQNNRNIKLDVEVQRIPKNLDYLENNGQ